MFCKEYDKNKKECRLCKEAFKIYQIMRGLYETGIGPLTVTMFLKHYSDKLKKSYTPIELAEIMIKVDEFIDDTIIVDANLN